MNKFLYMNEYKKNNFTLSQFHLYTVQHLSLLMHKTCSSIFFFLDVTIIYSVPSFYKYIYVTNLKFYFLNTCSSSSSPELEAQVNIFWSPAVRLSVNVTHFWILQNRWANFKQPCHNSWVGKGDLQLFKWRDKPL